METCMIIKGLKIFGISVIVAFLGWFAICYLDIVIHNLTPGYEYPWWNIFGVR